MALNSTSSRNGLSRNSTAPPFIAVAGDEDDRHGCLFNGDALLQLETISIRQRDIENEAMRHGNARAREEVLSGREYLRPPALGMDQQLERFTHRNVVVNNEDNRCCARRLAARYCHR